MFSLRGGMRKNKLFKKKKNIPLFPLSSLKFLQTLPPPLPNSSFSHLKKIQEEEGELRRGEGKEKKREEYQKKEKVLIVGVGGVGGVGNVIGRLDIYNHYGILEKREREMEEKGERKKRK